MFRRVNDIVAVAQREADKALATFTKSRQRLEKANEHLHVAKTAARLAVVQANARHDLAHRLQATNSATIAKLTALLGD